MINKVYQFASTEFLGGGGGIRGGRKREGEIINFLSLKRRAYWEGGNLIEDLLVFIFPQDFNWKLRQGFLNVCRVHEVSDLVNLCYGNQRLAVQTC